MRSAHLGTVLLIVTAACGGRASVSPAPAPAPADSMAPHSPAEEAARYAEANALRAQILRATVWERPPQEAPCDPGTLRTFPADSGRGYARVDSLIRRLERTIVAFGIDEPTDTPAGHALLRAVLAWEAGAERPRWDVPPGETPPRAVPAGLTGDFYNEDTRRCEPLAATDTVTLVVPQMTRFEAPKSFRTAKVIVFQGDSAMRHARDAFFTQYSKDKEATFLYTRMSSMVLWRDYAIVAVNRPAEKQGIFELQKGAGGATYVFRRERDEWRLLAIARTW